MLHPRRKENTRKTVARRKVRRWFEDGLKTKEGRIIPEKHIKKHKK